MSTPTPNAAAVAQQALDAAAHLGGGLVGEGDGQHAVGGDAHHFVEPADAVRQHAGLAGPGAGEHQQVARRGRHGLALGRVQAVEQVGNIHGAIVPAQGDALWEGLQSRSSSAKGYRD